MLELAIDQCLEMDVEIKITDCGDAALDKDVDDENDGDEAMGIFELDMGSPSKPKAKEKLHADVTVHEMANKLDAMMLLLLEHISRSANLPSIFRTLLRVFENSILITHKSKFVQFLLFYACGVEHRETNTKPDDEENSMHRDYLTKLVDVLVDPYRSIVTRQTGTCYLASFVSRAEYCGPETVCEAASVLLRWAEAYMGSIPALGIQAADAREQCTLHSLFYTVAQVSFLQTKTGTSNSTHWDNRLTWYPLDRLPCISCAFVARRLLTIFKLLLTRRGNQTN